MTELAGYGTPLVLIVSWITSMFLLRLIPKLEVKEQAMKKPVRPEITGAFLTGGLSLGILAAIGLISYSGITTPRMPFLGAVLTILFVSGISLFSDRICLSQKAKLLTFLFAGLPLALAKVDMLTTGPAIQAGSAPFLALILVPIGITGASYLTNQLEERGDLWMGLVATVSLAIVALVSGKEIPFLILLAGIGALIPALYYKNGKISDKQFIGDIGTYTIGVLIATAAILGGFELAGFMVLIPYLLNLGLKRRKRSLTELSKKLTGKLGQRNPVLSIVILEAAFGLIAILISLGFA